MKCAEWEKLAAQHGMTVLILPAHLDALEERAAIKEYDGKMTRQQAEKETAIEILGGTK